MSKKKSYMNRKNIIVEGYFDKVLGLMKFWKQIGRVKLSPEEKKILKKPSIQRKMIQIGKILDDSEDYLLKQGKKLGIEDKIKDILKGKSH